MAEPRCPHDFDSFIAKFETNQSVQSSQTRFPLLYSHLDHEDPYLKLKTIWLDRASAQKYETYPTADYLKRIGAGREQSMTNRKTCIVRFRVPDSDMYALDFSFRRWKGSWRLVSIRDHSL